MGLFRKKDYVAEWMGMNEDEKLTMIQSTFNGFVEGYIRARFIRQQPAAVDRMIDNIKVVAEGEGWFPDFSQKITEGYKESGLNKPPKKVVKTFISNYIKYYLGSGT